MLEDFEQAGSRAAEERWEVCVVGAGAAGILVATELARRGRRVLLLEGGGLQLEARSQAIYRSEVVGEPYRGVHEGRFRTYGGSTTRWGGQILELDREDFEPRAHVPGSGWPLQKAELMPYYERALVFEGLRRVQRNDALVWQALGVDPPETGDAFTMGFSRWCPVQNFAELHARELNELQRLTVLTHANVVGLELNESRSAIEAVRVRGFSGLERQMCAAQVVLCLGGIETVRLLMQPGAEGRLPWQQNGVLGRFYQDHLGLNGVMLVEGGWREPWRSFGYVTAEGFRYHNKLRLRPELQAANGTLNVAGTIGPWQPERPQRDRAEVLLREVVRSGRRPSAEEWLRAAWEMPGLAAARWRQRRGGEARLWRRLALVVHCEQSPQGASRISLSEQRDELGLLRSRVDWRISTEEIHSLQTYVRIAAEAFAKQGVARVVTPPGFYEDDELVRRMCGDSNHHMGGARMSAQPGEGVVDGSLRLHGVANGFVCSSAVFPTSGFSNPTHTLLALGMRLVDTLAGSGVRVEASAGPPQAMRPVRLPVVGTPVPQLGFGCSGLLGPGVDRARSLRLLDAAYEAGIRHFDVAALYGQGRSEALLGEFLRRRPEASVTTKYGVLPPTEIDRGLAAVQRRLPGPMAWWRRRDKARFTAAEARASLERSLRALGRERVELFLLHEPEAADLGDEGLLAFLQAEQARGRIGAFGVGGEYRRMEELVRSRPEFTQVTQFEHSIFGPELPGVPLEGRIYYRGFARAAAALGRRLSEDAGLAKRWSETVGAELTEPQVLARLLLRAALEDSPGTLLLFSSGSEERVFESVATASEVRSMQPALRLLALVREDDLGMGKELYPREQPGE